MLAVLAVAGSPASACYGCGWMKRRLLDLLAVLADDSDEKGDSGLILAGQVAGWLGGGSES